ncbi:MAG: thrombospondin type 3 repeat-containing protein, partial [Candidatus Heimdallarchaeota archaeon]
AVNNAGFIVTAGFAERKYDYIFQRLFIGLTIDEDDDNLSNFWEEEIGTNPTLFDTDQDGFSDGQEFLHNTDPLDKFSNTNNRRIMFGFSIAFTLLIIIIFLIINFFAKNKSSEETTTIVKIYDKITSKLKRKKEQNVID